MSGSLGVGDAGMTAQNPTPPRLLSEKRGYHVFDIGRWAIVVTVGQTSRTVFVDTDYTVDEPDRFERGRQAILSLGKELGVDFDWGPYGWTVGPAID